jgi:hypothetical protein
LKNRALRSLDILRNWNNLEQPFCNFGLLRFLLSDLSEKSGLKLEQLEQLGTEIGTEICIYDSLNGVCSNVPLIYCITTHGKEKGIYREV